MLSRYVKCISVTPGNVYQTSVNYNGVIQLRSAYTIVGNIIVFTEAPSSGSIIEVTTTQGVVSNNATFNVRTYTGTGSLTTFGVTPGATVSSVLVTKNGVLQTPTVDYTISNDILTFAVAPTLGVSIQIRELAVYVVTTTDPLSPFLLMGA